MFFQMYDKTEEGRSRHALYLPKARGMGGRNPLFLFATVSQLGGWSDVFAYMSIRDAYLPDFKILPSVQFFARMWHVAILVTSGLCRAIYWPPSAASTIYLPLLLLSPSRAVFFFYSCLLFLCLFLSFFHLFSIPFLFFPFYSLFSISTIPYDRVESTLEHYFYLHLDFDISNFLSRYFAVSTVIGLQTRGLVNNLKRNIL